MVNGDSSPALELIMASLVSAYVLAGLYFALWANVFAYCLHLSLVSSALSLELAFCPLPIGS
jgi:hypothetical protein